MGIPERGLQGRDGRENRKNSEDSKLERKLDLAVQIARMRHCLPDFVLAELLGSGKWGLSLLLRERSGRVFR